MKSFWYLATSYSRHPDGLHAAWKMALRATGLLIKAGVPVFSPIAHTHPIALECDIGPLDHDIWMPADYPMMNAAHGLIVLRDGEWEKSKGIAIERAVFHRAGKVVLFMDPGRVPVALLPSPGPHHHQRPARF